MPKNWIVESKQINSDKDFSMDLLYRTNDIDDFLQRTDICSISATKGFGKTFALKIKSINYRSDKTGATFIPQKELVDKFIPAHRPSISAQNKIQFNDIEKHSRLWELAIIITVISNTELLESVEKLYEKHPILRGLFAYEYSKSLQLNYSYLIDNYQIFHRIINKEKNLRRILIGILQSLTHAVYVFLDNIDEYYLEEQANYIHEGDIWFNSQIALIKCIYQIDQLSSHLHIYFTTRKRVLDKLQDQDVMYTQYMSSISEIKYAKHELKKIFINNIKKEQVDRLVFPDKLHKDPLLSFTGLSKIKNLSNSKNKSEDIFDYIYRHTFGRPRDLMGLGRSISHMAVESRKNIDELRTKVNNKSYDIGKQYIEELKYFIDVDFDKLCQLIKKNVLTKKEIKEICCKYNGFEPNHNCLECNGGDKYLNIFSILHLQGLIGYEKYDRFNSSSLWRQYFVTSGQQYISDDVIPLPDSEKYFIHPCFTEFIKKYRKDNNLSEFVPDKEVIVGNAIETQKKKNEVSKSNIHIHFGAGKLGVGLALKHFEKYNKIIIIQRDSEKVRKYSDGEKISFETRTEQRETTLFKAKVIREVSDINFTNKEHVYFISNTESKIKSLLSYGNSFSSALGPKGMIGIIKYFDNIKFDEEKNFYPFENDVNSVDNFFCSVNNEKLIRVNVMADRICTSIKLLQKKIYVVAENYYETVIHAVNDKVIHELDLDFYRTRLVNEKDYQYYYDRKFYIVNGLHMMFAIINYEKLSTQSRVCLKKARNIPSNIFLQDEEMIESLKRLIEMQSLRILLKHNEPFGKSNDKEYSNLLEYGDNVIERFDNPDDTLERIFNLNSETISNRKLKIYDRFLILLPLISKEKKALLDLQILEENEIDQIIDAVLKINSKLISILITEIIEKNNEIAKYEEK